MRSVSCFLDVLLPSNYRDHTGLPFAILQRFFSFLDCPLHDGVDDIGESAKR